MTEKAFSMRGYGVPESVFEVLCRAAESAAVEDARWLSADEISESMNQLDPNLIRRECLRLLGDNRILVKTFRRGLSQMVPRFRVKENRDALSGDKGGDALPNEAAVAPSVESPLNDPPYRIAHPRGGGRSRGSGRRKNG